MLEKAGWHMSGLEHVGLQFEETMAGYLGKGEPDPRASLRYYQRLIEGGQYRSEAALHYGLALTQGVLGDHAAARHELDALITREGEHPMLLSARAHNELEAGKTTGRELCPGGTLDRAELEYAAKDLLGHGVHEMVVVHTTDLAYGLAQSCEGLFQPALDLPPGFVKGSTGAGDAFFAGMLVAIHEGWDLEKAFTFAHAAAATCLRHPTATGGVGSADDIWQMSRRYPKKALP